MKVLVGCEYSGVVREAFRKLGHEAWSCDLLPADDDSEWHIQGDVQEAITSRQWDLIILHPPCTALAVSGNSTYGEGKAKHSKRLEAMTWTHELWELAKAHSKRVALENPVGVLSGVLGKPSYVNPWEHGHPEQKKTGLWLHNLKPLTPTNNVYDAMMKLPVQERQRLHYLPPSPDRWKIRSTTYKGIANAMAEQWTEEAEQ